MKMKQIVACAALVAASSVAAPAFAGATGNVGVFSDYMFRGVTQTGGAAVQGGLDYAFDSGFYLGTWGSNLNFAGSGGDGTEVDFYTGYAGKVGDLGFDVGALYYYYSEAEETAPATSPDTLELYAGLTYGPVGVKYYYTSEYFGTDKSASYVNFTLAQPLTETLTLTANIGLNDGDGVKAAFGDSYIDYSLGLAKSLDAGFTATFQIVTTDQDPAYGGGPDSDSPKVVFGLKKVFDL
ncbi:TorF family putative porin [Stagnimonas aquatica]|nr:TorF family putative porin [Stagnimonas aquatica]